MMTPFEKRRSISHDVSATGIHRNNASCEFHLLAGDRRVLSDCINDCGKDANDREARQFLHSSPPSPVIGFLGSLPFTNHLASNQARVLRPHAGQFDGSQPKYLRPINITNCPQRGQRNLSVNPPITSSSPSSNAHAPALPLTAETSRGNPATIHTPIRIQNRALILRLDVTAPSHASTLAW
jgi:hypothetical protein